MKKNILYFILGILITLVILGGIYLLSKEKNNKKEEESEIKLTAGFTEVDWKEKIKFPESEVKKSITFSYDIDIFSEPNILITIENGKLKITDKTKNTNHLLEIPNEKIISIATQETCGGNTIIPNYYVLTNKNNVYQSAKIYDEITEKFMENALTTDLTLIYDGEQISKDAKVSFINLNSVNGFSTCFFNKVYLKIDDKVTDFNNQNFEDIITIRMAFPGDKGYINYFYNGAIEILNNEVSNKIVDENQNEIHFILIGTYNNQNYLLDENGNEYIFNEDFYNYFTKEDRNPLKESTKREIVKIGQKGSQFEIVFKDKTRKIVESEDNYNIFSIVS